MVPMRQEHNNVTSLDAGMTVLSHDGDLCPGASEFLH